MGRRPKLKGSDVAGILPQDLEQGANDMMADQCAEYISEYAIAQKGNEFASGETIYCAVKMCDLGSTTLQEATVLYAITKRREGREENPGCVWKNGKWQRVRSAEDPTGVPLPPGYELRDGHVQINSERSETDDDK